MEDGKNGTRSQDWTFSFLRPERRLCTVVFAILVVLVGRWCKLFDGISHILKLSGLVRKHYLPDLDRLHTLECKF